MPTGGWDHVFGHGKKPRSWGVNTRVVVPETKVVDESKKIQPIKRHKIYVTRNKDVGVSGENKSTPESNQRRGTNERTPEVL